MPQTTCDPAAISFRRVEMADMPLLHRWLNASHVREWYAKDPRTLEAVLEKYGPRVRGEAPTDPYLILHEGEPVGYIQTYLIRDYPEYSRALDLDEAENAAGVDLYIGEPVYLRRGLGSAALRRFVREIVFADASVTSCILGPEPENAAAIRAYEKAGFRYLKTVRVPGEPAPEYLMRATREDLG
jgi:RimJ/RimL family protein N-acetyltransferase